VRLSSANLSRVSSGIGRPRYDRDAQCCGIVHIGLGAFHRAHQAVYTDDAMNDGDRNWGIIGVSLRSAAVQAQLAPQDGLYTVRERQGGESRIRLIGAVRRVLVAPQDPVGVVDALAHPDTHIVTCTITEKGYCRGGDGRLDRAAPELASDLAANSAPKTLYGFLASALAARRRSGLPGLTLLCCDNLAENGSQLAALLGEFIGQTDPGSLAWFQEHCRCPSSMVDRIVPATTAADRAQTELDIGLCDEATLNTEPFRQWIIEDNFAGSRPHWETGGAQFVQDVAPFEAAKLRMLNGAHSALAYLGLAHGHEFVHQAIEDPVLRPLIEHLMRDEAAPSLSHTAGLDLDWYADALIARFSNKTLRHRLAQIAMDGSQKIPQRWLQTLRIQEQKGQDCPALLQAMAAWIVFLRQDAQKAGDPMAAALVDLWRRQGTSGIVDALAGPGGVFARHWSPSTEIRGRLTRLVAAFSSAAPAFDE
jgi:fructuronate reductase